MGQFILTSAVDYKDIDLSWMTRRVITEVSFYDPAMWSFIFGPDVYIQVECLWRIVEHGRVVLTNQDHGHKFGLPAPMDAVAMSTELLAGRSISAVQLRDATADIVIEFSGDLRLEIIPISAGYERWQLRDPFGASYVAQGGGQISTWT